MMVGKHELPSAPAKWRAYTKTLIAVIGALVSALTPIASGVGQITWPEIVQAALAALTAAGVFQFENVRAQEQIAPTFDPLPPTQPIRMPR